MLDLRSIRGPNRKRKRSPAVPSSCGRASGQGGGVLETKLGGLAMAMPVAGRCCFGSVTAPQLLPRGCWMMPCISVLPKVAADDAADIPLSALWVLYDLPLSQGFLVEIHRVKTVDLMRFNIFYCHPVLMGHLLASFSPKKRRFDEGNLFDI